MVIDFTRYAEMRKTQQLAAQAAYAAETAQREHLEQVLTDLLAELQAA